MPIKFVETKWRPPLWAIIIVSLLIVTLLPMVGLAFILLAENMLDLRFTLRSLQGGALLAVACISTALLVGFVLVRTLVRPLQALEARARNIDAGGAITRDLFQHAGTREMARLAESFIETAQKLSRHSEQMSLFTSHVTHEFKAPLTSIRGAVELLDEAGNDMPKRRQVQFLKNIKDDVDRLEALTDRLRQLAYVETTHAEGWCDPVAELAKIAAARGLNTDVKSVQAITAKVSAENFGIIAGNLVSNAKENDAICLYVDAEQMGDEVRILIGDDGKAISENNRDRLFDPFFTTKRAAGGTGMGLSIARAMAQAQGGKLALAENGRSKFSLVLPAT